MRRFYDKVDRLISDRADDPAPFTVGILDLDGFKPINDLFGHKAGDEILVQVAMRLRAAMDGQSTVTRIGADEFAFLYPLVFSEEAAAEKSQDADRDPVGALRCRRAHGAAVGLGRLLAVLFRRRDHRNPGPQGRDRALPGQALRPRPGRRLHARDGRSGQARHPHRAGAAPRRLGRRGRAAFPADRRSAGRAAPSASRRWRAGPTATSASCSPAVFIPIAEERGIIGPLSQLVLRKATEAARNWPKDLFLSFNLSPSQLVDQNTGLHILAILDRTGFDPRRLEIEITETGLMTDPASAEKIVEDLRRCGIRVSLDDFGTGQSSLGRLREFHFDKLKIDRAFVSSILDDRPSEHIIRAILAMCEGLGMDVVAEGIEEEAQADRLVQFGCGGGQGYLFGRPVNADATLGYLRDALRGALRANGDLTGAAEHLADTAAEQRKRSVQHASCPSRFASPDTQSRSARMRAEPVGETTMMPSARFPDLEGASVLITGGGSRHRRGADRRLCAPGRARSPSSTSPRRRAARWSTASRQPTGLRPLYLKADLRDIEALRAAAAAGGRSAWARHRARSTTPPSTSATTIEEVDGRLLGQQPGDQSAAAFLHRAGGRARHEGGRRRLDHQFHLDLLPDQPSRHAVLHGRQGRHHRPDQGAGRQARPGRHPRQRDRAGLGDHRAAAGALGHRGERSPPMSPSNASARSCSPTTWSAPCLFLASDASRMLTAQTLIVDGGYL